MDLSRKIFGTLVLSNTGTLLFQADGQSEYVSLEGMARLQAPDQVNMFLLRYFDAPFRIEEGATLSHFFFALEPWKDCLTMQSDRNIGAYIQACRTPAAVSNPNDEIIRLEIRRSGSLRRHIKYERSKDDAANNWEEWFNTPATKVETPVFAFENYLSATGFIAEQPEDVPDGYGLSGTKFSDLRNAQLVVDHRLVITAFKDDNLINANDPVVGCDLVRDKYWSIQCTTPNNELRFRDVFEAIVVNALFYQTPAGLNGCAKFLSDQSEEKAVFEELEKQSETASEGESTEMKITFAPGAFDSLAQSLEADHNVWQHVCASDKKNSIVRIGAMVFSEKNAHDE